jgi:CheY-like chemotaxis protein
MKILVVEDAVGRQEWFVGRFAADELYLTDSAAEAIAWLGEHNYDIIFLDHDLKPHHSGFDDDGLSGYEVAKHLMSHSAPRIVCHSQNIFGALRITEFLRGRGLPVESIPFPFLADVFSEAPA